MAMSRVSDCCSSFWNKAANLVKDNPATTTAISFAAVVTLATNYWALMPNDHLNESLSHNANVGLKILYFFGEMLPNMGLAGILGYGVDRNNEILAILRKDDRTPLLPFTAPRTSVPG